MTGAMLLLGLAVENALKGAVVYKAKPDLNNDKLKPSHFHEYAHDLKDVAEKLDVELSDIPNDYYKKWSYPVNQNGAHIITGIAFTTQNTIVISTPFDIPLIYDRLLLFIRI